MRKIYLIGFILLLSRYAQAQEQTKDEKIVADAVRNSSEKKDVNYLSQPAFTRLINRSFSQVAVGPASGSNLANYASFEPVNGSFTFNGFAPIGAGKEDKIRMSYVNFAVKGGINGDNIGALFSDNKLNTNVNVSLKYHFGIFQRSITYDAGAKQKMDQAKSKLNAQNIAELEQYKRELRVLGDIYLDNSRNLDAIKLKINAEEKKLDTVRSATALIATGQPPNSASYNKLTDSCLHMTERINKLYLQLDKQKFIVDSLDNENRLLQRLRLGDPAAEGYVRGKVSAINRNTQTKLAELETSAKIDKIHFGWFSINADFNKQKYYTFIDTLTFGNQITKELLTAFKIGVSCNYYWQDIQNGKVFYVNSGISRLKTNNTSDLSPTAVDDTRTIVNGETKRAITTKYSAYTSPITEFLAWQVYLNVYYLFGKQNTSGIHINPEINFRDDRQNVDNVSLGYVISFKDKKDSKSIINAEAYVKFTDIGNALNQERGFYKRTEIGVSFGIPFNYIFSSSK